VGVRPDASQCDGDAEGDMGKPELPHVDPGEPQRADGAARNTPPKALRLRPSCWTREAPPGMQRSMGSRRGANALRKTNALIGNPDEGGVAERAE